LASVETGPMAGITREPESFEGHQFSVTRGDYSPLLKLVVEELQKAKVKFGPPAHIFITCYLNFMLLEIRR
jgi:hypothetical protein